MDNIVQLLRNAPNRINKWYDFMDSNEVAIFTSAAGTISQQPTPGGKMRLATGASDNDACEARLDAAVFQLTVGRHWFGFLFDAPSDVDNADIGIGLATDDADVIGDAATATELLYLGFDDQGSTDGVTPLVLKTKNASGSENFATGLNIKEGNAYLVQLEIDVDVAGTANVTVVCTRVNVFGGEQVSVVASDEKRYRVQYAPTGTLNLICGIQAGEAASKTWDFDGLGYDVPRHT